MSRNLWWKRQKKSVFGGRRLVLSSQRFKGAQAWEFRAPLNEQRHSDLPAELFDNFTLETRGKYGWNLKMFCLLLSLIILLWLYPRFPDSSIGGCHTTANTQIMLPICVRTARHNYLSLCYKYSTWRYLTQITSFLYLGDPRLTCTGQESNPGLRIWKLYKVPAPPCSLIGNWERN